MAKVTVQGLGKATGQPDIAVIQITVRNEAKDQRTARQENNAASEQVVEILKKVVAENDLYVVPARVHPQYNYQKRGGNQIVGYQATNILTAKIRNLDIAQDLLTEINNLDPEKVQVTSFQFDIDDKEPLESEARKKAFANAKARAEVYAQESQLTMTGLKSLNEEMYYGNRGGGGRHPSAKFAAARAMDAEGGGPEILELGDIEVNVTVTACFKLEKPA